MVQASGSVRPGLGCLGWSDAIHAAVSQHDRAAKDAGCQGMFEHYEGHAAAGLFVFMAGYRYRIEWYVALPAILLVGLILGVLLLARQKTPDSSWLRSAA